MSTGAIIMMLVAIAIIWGGLALAILNLNRGTAETPGRAKRDL